MMDAYGHPQAAVIAVPGILQRILDACRNRVTRTIDMATRNLGNEISAQRLGRVVNSAAGSVYKWLNLVVDVLRRPVSYKLEVQRRPVWMQISVVLVLALAAQGLIHYMQAASSGLSVTTVAHDLQGTPTVHDLQEATTHPDIGQHQVPGLHLSPPPYTPDESGIVAEICYLVAQVTKQTARSPGAQTLYEFVDSSGAADSDSLPRQKLCGACLASDAIRVAASERAGASSWEKQEAEERLRTLERSIILTSDPTSDAVYRRLFVDGVDSEDYDKTVNRIFSLCGRFWR